MARERKSAAASPSSWADLPPDLLGVVLRLLHSHTDRVRVAAVCRPWRSGALLQLPLPPPMPWAVLGERTYVDLAGNASHALTLRTYCPLSESCLAVGDRLFLAGRSCCFLVNPFLYHMDPIQVLDLAFFRQEQRHEKTRFGLWDHAGVAVTRVAAKPSLGSSPADTLVVVAALMHTKGWGRPLCKTIFVCMAGTDTHVDAARYTAMSAELPPATDDIAFFQGKLYALTRTMELYLVEHRQDSGGNPTIGDVKCVIREPSPVIVPPENGQVQYLLDSGDRLLLVKRRAILAKSGITHRFEVLEADLAASPGRWTAAPSLRGRALFVGNRGSQSLPAVGDGRCGAQEDCVYSLRRQANYKLRLLVVDVYNVRDGTMTSTNLPSPETAEHSWDPIWFFHNQPCC